MIILIIIITKQGICATVQQVPSSTRTTYVLCGIDGFVATSTKQNTHTQNITSKRKKTCLAFIRYIMDEYERQKISVRHKNDEKGND